MMKNAKYSILTSDSSIVQNHKSVSDYLMNGIKVLLFGNLEDLEIANKGNEKFVNARLLQLYKADVDYPEITIYDGIVSPEESDALHKLSALSAHFNLEQYVIEHCNAEENMIVEAGAGTGKTTVMVDRIMFLLHTLPNLNLDDIGMITFTNEATQHMKHKIQQELMKRFRTTGLSRYVMLLEKSASLRIQTIDSFSKEFVSEYGTSIGYGSRVSVRGYKYEKDRLIRDTLDELYAEKKNSVEKSLGLKLHELEDLIYKFWERLGQAGLSDNEIAAIDWGMPHDTDSQALHITLTSVFTKLCERYNELKKKNDAISVDDIVRELDRIILSGYQLNQKSHQLKYLFVDEFQDSDNSQIRTISWLQKHSGLRLFVVGDVKQSIYRFRGAVDTAFKKLKGEIENYSVFSLVRNYRTSSDILSGLDPVFRSWEQKGLFDYGTTLQAQKQHPGNFTCHPVLKKKTVICNEATRLIKECLNDCVHVAKASGSEKEKTQHVTVLARTNFQLDTIAEWCRSASIPCYLRTEGTFYTSRAVLDFFAMIKAYTFPTTPQHLIDYALSPYASGDFNPALLEAANPGSEGQKSLMTEFLENSDWSNTLKKLRLKPVMSVIDEIVGKANPTLKFAAIQKMTLTKDRTWTEDDLKTQVVAEARQYSANTDKLLTLLRSHFSGQMADLYSIYNYLKLNIATNKSEDEPDISDDMGPKCVYGLTVHKAKGLEFDTVIIPFTYREYRHSADTEILLDEKQHPLRAGWSKVEWQDQYHSVIESQKMNNYYIDCSVKEYGDVDREEARLLYVALTRSIRRLECFVIDPQVHNWAGLLRWGK